MSSETITVGSGSSKGKFDSTDSIIIPKGTKLKDLQQPVHLKEQFVIIQHVKYLKVVWEINGYC